MDEQFVARNRDWREEIARKIAPFVQWEVVPVYVRNGHGAGPNAGPPYVAIMHTPPSWLHEDVTGLHVNPLPESLDDRDSDGEDGDDSGDASEPVFWVTLHGYDPNAVGIAACVAQTALAEWRVVRGGKGRLVGAVFTHLMSPAGYAAWKTDNLIAQMNAMM